MVSIKYPEMISSAGPTIPSTAFNSGRKKYNKARDNYHLWNFYGGGWLIIDSQKRYIG